MIFNPHVNHPQALPFGLSELTRQYSAADHASNHETAKEIVRSAIEADGEDTEPLINLITAELDRRITPPVAPEDGLETTAEEREQWLHSIITLGESKRRILRDFNHLLTALYQARADLKRAQLIDSEGHIVNPTEWLSAQLIVRETAARKEEREACAQIAQNYWASGWETPDDMRYGQKRIAAAIRARSQT